MKIDSFFDLPIYDLDAAKKNRLLLETLSELSGFHEQNSHGYRNILHAYGQDDAIYQRLEDFVPLAIRLFKQYELRSVGSKDIFKTLLSSGTTGTPSKIYLDRITAGYQSKALVKIMQHWLGKQRLPMLIIDHPSTMQNRLEFSARAAGIQGMMLFGRDHTYALNEDMSFNHEAVSRFMQSHAGKGPVFLYGFTFMVWKYFIRYFIQAGFEFEEAILIHGGGWKKLQNESVDNQTFKKAMGKVGISRVHNYYGMVEQTGSVFVECEKGLLHAPVFADILIRDPLTMEVKESGEGVIELLSVLPYSYPGHVLLSEDIGVLHGRDNCECGRKGAVFDVIGRLPASEARGCSDVYAV